MHTCADTVSSAMQCSEWVPCGTQHALTDCPVLDTALHVVCVAAPTPTTHAPDGRHLLTDTLLACMQGSSSCVWHGVAVCVCVTVVHPQTLEPLRGASTSTPDHPCQCGAPAIRWASSASTLYVNARPCCLCSTTWPIQQPLGGVASSRTLLNEA